MNAGSPARVLALAALLVLAAVTSAGADDAAAEQTFREARRLAKEGRFAEACPRFEASYRETPALGALLNLAFCHEQLGRTASAYAEYRAAQEMARQRADAREPVARGLADALAPRLTRLQLHLVQPQPPGITVRRDGADASLGTAVAVDPGDHVVEASAPGHVTWRATVTVAGEGQTLSVHVPALVARPASLVDAIVVAAAPATPPTRATRRIVGYGLGAGAVLAFGGALGAELAGRERWRRAREATAQDAADALVDAANRRRYLAEGLAVAGVGLAAASAYLWLSDEGDARPRRFQVVPAVGDGAAQAVLRGWF